MKYKIGIVAGIKNDVELIKPFIQHHLRLGIAKIHIIDFKSTDGSREVLETYRNHPQIELMLSDSNNGVPHVHQMHRLSAYRDNDIDYLVYLDLDEFLVVSPNTSLDQILDAHPSQCYYLHRHNILPVQAFREGLSDALLQNLHKMLYFTAPVLARFPIEKPSLEWRDAMREPTLLKSMHDKSTIIIGFGGHRIYSQTIPHAVFPKGLFIAHFPITTFSRMMQKLQDVQNLILKHPLIFTKEMVFRYHTLVHVLQTNQCEDLYENIFLSKTEVLDLLNIQHLSRGERLLSEQEQYTPLQMIPLDNSYILSKKLAQESD